MGTKAIRIEKNRFFLDQVSSTRIVIDGAGAVVYSSAHGPFGDTQTTWTNSYEPKQQYSGKEREHYSQFDYFGARYYDNSNYRFLSVDPIRNKDEALANPQLWNLYSYCRNNPITYLDPNGEYDRVKAVQYALKYAYNPNPVFKEFYYDCANFTSQSVHAGEVSMKSDWYMAKVPLLGIPFIRTNSHSKTWSVAQDLYEYFSSSEYSSGQVKIDSAEKIKEIASGGQVKPGDLIFWDFEDSGHMGHSAIITGISKEEIFFSGHTIARRNKKLSDFVHPGNIVKIVNIKDDAK